MDSSEAKVTSDDEKEDDLEEIQVLLPSTMELDSDGIVKFKEQLAVGSVILADEGNVQLVRVAREIVENVKKDYFEGVKQHFSFTNLTFSKCLERYCNSLMSC